MLPLEPYDLNGFAGGPTQKQQNYNDITIIITGLKQNKSNHLIRLRFRSST